MEFFLIPVEDFRELCPHLVEHCRKSNDGTMCIVHKDTLLRNVAAFQTQVNNLMLDENGEPQEPQYPYELRSGDEINVMSEFQNKENINN